MRFRYVVLAGCWSVLCVAQGCNQVDSLFGTNNQSKQVKQFSNERNILLARLAGQQQHEKLETLLNIVQHDHEKSNRRDALNYLSGLGVEAAPISESLAEQLVIETDADIVRDLQRVLVASEANVEKVLLSAVPIADATQIVRIIETLGDTRASSSQTLAFLEEKITSENIQFAVSGCQSLEKIGPNARGLLPVLLAIAERPRTSLEGTSDGGRAFRESKELTKAAIRAISAVGADDTTVPLLTDCLAMEPDIAVVAADTLASLGVKAASARPALELLSNRNDHGGKDIKTKLAREAAFRAIAALKNGVDP